MALPQVEKLKPMTLVLVYTLYSPLVHVHVYTRLGIQVSLRPIFLHIMSCLYVNMYIHVCICMPLLVWVGIISYYIYSFS